MKGIPSKCERCGKLFDRTKTSQHAMAYTCQSCIAELDATPVPVSLYADDAQFSFASGAFRKRFPLSDLVEGYRPFGGSKPKRPKKVKL